MTLRLGFVVGAAVTCSQEARPCSGSDTPEHREYTRFRLEAMDQRWVIVGDEGLDRRTRETFRALARTEREAAIAWWGRRVRECLARDYWTLLEAAVRSYAGLRGWHETAVVIEDGDVNREAMPRALPPTLPAGTKMLFGEYHGRGLPSDAELKDCVVPVGMSLHETTTEKRYAYTREDGSRDSTPPEYVDWRRHDP